MYSNWLSKMFGVSLKALKAKHLGKLFSNLSAFVIYIPNPKVNVKKKDFKNHEGRLLISKPWSSKCDFNSRILRKLSFLPRCFASKAFKEAPNILEKQKEYVFDHWKWFLKNKNFGQKKISVGRNFIFTAKFLSKIQHISD